MLIINHSLYKILEDGKVSNVATNFYEVKFVPSVS